MIISNIGKTLFLVALGSLGAVLGLYFFKFNGQISNNQNVWGTFGDFVGGTLNPILAFASLCAILLTMKLQSEELKNTTEAMDKQGDYLALQAFENTLFSLLSTYDNKFSSVSEGRGKYKDLYSKLKLSYDAEVIKSKSDKEIDIIRAAYLRFYQKNRADIQPAMVLLVQIVDYIKSYESTISTISHMDVFRSMLSEPEILLFFYHVVSLKGYDSVKALFICGVFADIETNQLLNPSSHKRILE